MAISGARFPCLSSCSACLPVQRNCTKAPCLSPQVQLAESGSLLRHQQFLSALHHLFAHKSAVCSAVAITPIGARGGAVFTRAGLAAGESGLDERVAKRQESMKVQDADPGAVKSQATSGHTAGSGPSPAEGRYRNGIQVGMLVDVVQKKDQAGGRLTRGIVSKILTNSQEHHRGVKVRLEGGAVGRVQAVIGSPPKGNSSGRATSTASLQGKESPDGANGSKASGGGARRGKDVDEDAAIRNLLGNPPGTGDASTRKLIEIQKGRGRLFVSGLPRSTTDVEFKKAIESITGVERFNLVFDSKEGLCKGYGFVDVRGDLEGALKALRGVKVLGRSIQADLAGRPSSDKAAGSKSDKPQSRGKPASIRSEQEAAKPATGVADFSFAAPAAVESVSAAGAPLEKVKKPKDVQSPRGSSSQLADKGVKPSQQDHEGQPGAATEGPGEEEPVSMGALVIAAMQKAAAQKAQASARRSRGVASKAKGYDGSADLSSESDSETDELGPVQPLVLDPSWEAQIADLRERLVLIRSQAS